ncbi:hypothetical protein ABQF13_07140, partial [Mycolicibacterium sp. XJ879]
PLRPTSRPHQRTLNQEEPIYPGVYAAKGNPSLHDRAVGAWLWSKRQGVITGVVASALHGAEWVDDRQPIELIWRATRPPRGLVVRNERIADDEITRLGDLSVATPARAAFDIGRYLRLNRAVERLDALMRAEPFSTEDVLLLAKRYRRARGLKTLRRALPLVDGGAASLQETRLRLLFIDAGFPRPTTQIPVYDEKGHLVRILDMGWEDYGVAGEYDGDQHRTDRYQYVKDLRVYPKLERLGWLVSRVIKEDRPDDIIERTYRAMKARGWKGQVRWPRRARL